MPTTSCSRRQSSTRVRTWSNRAEPAVVVDGAGKTSFRGMKSLQPAPLLNSVGRRPEDERMTIPGFGRLTPIQMDMLELAGINLDRRRYGFDPFNPGTETIPDEDRIEIMKRGRASLVKQTGQDFGFDLEVWQRFLVAHADLGYTHPYGSLVTKKYVRAAIADPERQRLLSLIEGRAEPDASADRPRE